jgi:hypothetical protein
VKLNISYPDYRGWSNYSLPVEFGKPFYLVGSEAVYILEEESNASQKASPLRVARTRTKERIRVAFGFARELFHMYVR